MTGSGGNDRYTVVDVASFWRGENPEKIGRVLNEWAAKGWRLREAVALRVLGTNYGTRLIFEHASTPVPSGEGRE